MAKKTQPILTKQDVLELLSNQMRKPDVAPNVLVKLSTMYAKISGWKPNPQAEPKETSFDQLVAETERKRKQEAQ